MNQPDDVVKLVVEKAAKDLIDGLLKPYRGKPLEYEQGKEVYDKVSSEFTSAIIGFMTGGISLINTQFLQGEHMVKIREESNAAMAGEILSILNEIDYKTAFASGKVTEGKK